MQSKSNYVKSKKQKMLQKQRDKQRQREGKQNAKQPNIQVIDSSSQQSKSIQILAVPEVQQKKTERLQPLQKIAQFKERKHNNFNYQRLQKVTGSIRTERPSNFLQVQQNFGGILESTSTQNKTITYKKYGINAQKTVCDSYLRSRLEGIPDEQNDPKASNVNRKYVQIGEGQVDLEENKQQKQEEQQKNIKINHIPRYFDEQISSSSVSASDNQQEEEKETRKSIRCYRCGEKGHISRMCNQRQTIRCLYCLGSHHNSQCTDMLCHKCNEKGHIKQQCRSDQIQCHRCRKYGHVAKNCGKIIMMNFTRQREKQIRQRYDTRDLERLKCLKCNGIKDSKGHFNCHQYLKKIPKVYNQQYCIL